MLNVTQKDLEIIRAVLRKSGKKLKVMAFGSRVTEDYKITSDLDLVIISGLETLSNSERLLCLAQIKEDFELSDLTFRVDLSDINELSEEFKQAALNDSVEISV
jgi:uncharacterized protein